MPSNTDLGTWAHVQVASSSISAQPLAWIESDGLHLHDRVKIPPCQDSMTFKVHEVDCRVAVVRLYPGFHVDVITALRKAGIRGIIFQSFGAGDGPIDRPEFRAAIAEGIMLRQTVFAYVAESRGRKAKRDASLAVCVEAWHFKTVPDKVYRVHTELDADVRCWKPTSSAATLWHRLFGRYVGGGGVRENERAAWLQPRRLVHSSLLLHGHASAWRAVQDGHRWHCGHVGHSRLWR